MKCPRCVQTVTPAAASCPHCGYTMGAACELYGSGAVVVERLMDVEGALSAEEREGVVEAIGEFDRRFPQLFLLVYVGPLPPPASPRQFAFWLLNHAAVAEADAFHPSERGVLLVVDPKAGTAVLTAGYFLEPLIRQEELDRLLRGAAKDFGKADYRSAVQTLTAGMTPLLQQRAREAAKHPDTFREALPETDQFPPLVRTGEVPEVELARLEGFLAKPEDDVPQEVVKAPPTGRKGKNRQEPRPRAGSKPHKIRRR